MENKQNINEHDLTKKMIDTLRGKTLIKENDEGNDVISPNQNDDIYKQELKKIADVVTPRIQITRFKIYPKDRDVQVDGKLDVGINFKLSVKALKPIISITDENGKAKDIFIDDEIVHQINTLQKYYKNWSDEWIEKLNTEYKPK